MVELKRIFKDYEQSGALNALVNVHAAISENVFLTKSGDLLMLAKVKGIDPECLDHPQVDQISRRFESALRTFDDHFHLYQYLLKRAEAPPPCSPYAHPVVEEANRSRIAYFRARSSALYSIENYMAVLYEGWIPVTDLRSRLRQFVFHPRAALGEMLSDRRAAATLAQEIDRAREILTGKVTSFALQLKDILDIEILDKQRGYGFLRRLLNYEPFKADGARLADDRWIDFQACDSTLELHRDHLRLDDNYVQVLTMKEPPARTFAHVFKSLVEIPSNFVIASEWKRESSLKVRRLIQSKRRHFHNAKSSLLNYVNTSSQTPAHDVLVDDSAVAHVANLGACLEEIEIRGRAFGQFSLTIVLYGKDRAAVRAALAECFKVCAQHDAHLNEERCNLLNAWLAALPGNGAYNLRRLWLTSANYADLSFLFTSHQGERRNQQLRTEYLALLETSIGTLYYLNLHYQDVAHTLILGSTGSGKSFLLNFLLTNLQKYEPFTFIFDICGSYETLTHLFGGSYLRMASLATNSTSPSFTINPFCLPPTPENLQFIFAFVKVLVEQGGYRMDARQDQELFEQIQNLYEVDREQRRLLTLYSIVGRNLRAQLQKWVAGGPYAAFFDNAEDNLTFSRFQTFDFQGIDKKPDVLEALLFYILHRASATIQDAERLRVHKAFILDEAWRFFRHPTTRLYILEAVKTWRQKNAAMILATQSSEDLVNSEILPVVIESCPTKLFLANPDMDRAAYQRMFHLTDAETECITSLVPKQEFLLKTPEVSKRLRLNVDPTSYWIYTSNPHDQQVRQEAFKRHGFKDGLEILARRKT